MIKSGIDDIEPNIYGLLYYYRIFVLNLSVNNKDRLILESSKVDITLFGNVGPSFLRPVNIFYL